MARQDGIIKLKGQMGGVSFYKTTEDGYLARQKGGVDAERIKNDPEFERTRENGAEFGRAGVASKLLRTALRALILKASDSRMASRLTKEMVKVVQADVTSIRGQRNVIDGEVELLLGFEFNLNGKLSNTFFVPYTTTLDRPSGNLTVDVPAFIPGNMLASPQGATHYKLVSAGAEVDFEAGAYVMNTVTSPETEIGPAQQPPIGLAAGVTPGTTKPVFIAFGIEFLQQINGQLYPLKNGAYNALALVAIDGGV